MDEKLTKISKQLALVLRHHPEKINITLDEYGRVEINELINKFNAHYSRKIDRQKIEEIINNSPRQRYVIEGTKIRALYGHSVSVLPLQEAVIPPKILYHGTSQAAAKIIQAEGLNKMGREFVHLSEKLETAIKIGSRHDTSPIIFQVYAKKAATDGYAFYSPKSGVWLVENLPAIYLKKERQI
ncbi:RNA 2'-phosphotransferase [Tetragenococcus halophilus]|uniref:RNA 2'-phosphotransferase n=1 Tax=Tetragenococcus halophilus TaxID=51669 RepID=UPI000B926E57|nr:RNA 2'-phosphotransferase [Tetragenococcus halophilus]NWO01033.1 RNA 2'-phosphotransferase [Tetragenococcus halophilus]RQD29438.1 RNA 2'-phosphotransferase [Tetragenococcus halophilus subsp. halophilus DSM 20339]WJS81570.1 RNA 2'-phosphotransferase [Tetragenococcus halophilus]GBD58266.1 Probable RNA 2'-phosphotransferase [Tetragenococcus halophilus subsp. halophilus]GBD62064.1 Probable RNA 2'-phosphotransferase [Tetragenococcus halophilus subsp. halophilus]